MSVLPVKHGNSGSGSLELIILFMSMPTDMPVEFGGILIFLAAHPNRTLCEGKKFSSGQTNTVIAFVSGLRAIVAWPLKIKVNNNKWSNGSSFCLPLLQSQYIQALENLGLYNVMEFQNCLESWMISPYHLHSFQCFVLY